MSRMRPRMADFEPMPGADRERERWGHFPVVAREALLEAVNPDRPPFPFQSWAMANRFEYPAAFRGFFCRCASAAEAYFIRPFLTREGVVALGDGRAQYRDTVLNVAVPCRRYVIDAVVEKGAFKLAIEIDGLDYHHRNAQQIAADYVRERRVVLLGYTVIRFTSREVFFTPDECWRQIDAIMEAR